MAHGLQRYGKLPHRQASGYFSIFMRDWEDVSERANFSAHNKGFGKGEDLLMYEVLMRLNAESEAENTNTVSQPSAKSQS